MSTKINPLRMEFCGDVSNRQVFLRQIRAAVMELTGETMTLDTLINEIAKNIFDHACGIGFLEITPKGDSFDFVIRDGGQDSHDFEAHTNHSTLAGNKMNFGVGLKMIRNLAKGLGIDLRVDTSKGFSYSGTYTPE